MHRTLLLSAAVIDKFPPTLLITGTRAMPIKLFRAKLK